MFLFCMMIGSMGYGILCRPDIGQLTIIFASFAMALGAFAPVALYTQAMECRRWYADKDQ